MLSEFKKIGAAAVCPVMAVDRIGEEDNEVVTVVKNELELDEVAIIVLVVGFVTGIELNNEFKQVFGFGLGLIAVLLSKECNEGELEGLEFDIVLFNKACSDGESIGFETVLFNKACSWELVLTAGAGTAF